MFWAKHSRQLLFRQLTWLRYKAVYRLRSSCLNITFELHNLRFSSISFQILTKLWFGSLDENVVRGLVLNIMMMMPCGYVIIISSVHYNISFK